MPEEANRRLTDHLSVILLAHSDSAVVNLVNEGIDATRIHLVGNTMIDSVFRHLQRALAREPWSRFGVFPGEFALVTLHRPALVDDIELLRPTTENLALLAQRMPVIFPVHPRTRARLAAAGLRADELSVRGVHLCEPLSYLDFLGLEASAGFLLTDSGGVQEETSALGVRCFTLRDTTERPVTIEVGTNTLLGANPARIREIPKLLDAEVRTPREIPYWDGAAGTRAAAVLSEFIASPRKGELADPAPTAESAR
jgi:UDP-N-acetylglucosamine 2-epimerase (non-hydrolysing)